MAPPRRRLLSDSVQALVRAAKAGRAIEPRIMAVDALSLMAFVASSGPTVTLEVMHRLEDLRSTGANSPLGAAELIRGPKTAMLVGRCALPADPRQRAQSVL